MVLNDARGCFYQMALAIGSLCFQHLKVLQSAIKTLMTTLRKKKTQHYIRTAHRDLETFYSGLFDKLFQGGGQGNGAAGPMWIAISIILINIIQKIGIGAKFVSAMLIFAMKVIVIMYIDDTDLIITGMLNNNRQFFNNKVQQLISK